MARKRWQFDPNSGGVTIPEHKRGEVKRRLEKYAAENYAGRYTRLEVRFRGQFCYIDAYTEPAPLTSSPSLPLRMRLASCTPNMNSPVESA